MDWDGGTTTNEVKMRYAQMPPGASCLPSMTLGQMMTSDRRSLRLDVGQTQQTRRIKMLVTKSPTAVDYARAEHDKSPGTSVIAADPTRGAWPARSMQTTIGKCRGMAPIETVIASIASTSTTMAAQRGAHGHPTA